MSEQVATRSHPGQRRSKNEDSMLAVRLGDEWLLAVADGVGGERGGEVASSEAIAVLEERARALPHEAASVRLTRAIEAACRQVWEHSQLDDRVRGMATTMVAAIAHAGAHGAEVWVANVGDSRASLVRDGETQAISEDHSLVAESLREGEMTEEEAWTSNLRHVITRTVGSEEEVEVDVFGPLTLGAGETLVLSSDGLHDFVEANAIARLASGDDLDAAAEALVVAANAAGGPDNITVVLYRVG